MCLALLRGGITDQRILSLPTILYSSTLLKEAYAPLLFPAIIGIDGVVL